MPITPGRTAHGGVEPNTVLYIRNPRVLLRALVSALIPIVGDHRGRDDSHESATRCRSRQTRG
jgi:hypothetical protein